MTRTAFLSVLSIAFLIPGCNQLTGNWMQGTWEFDREYTEAQMKSAQPENEVDGFLKSLGKIVSGFAMFTMEGTKLIITEDEFIRMQGGSGQSTPYEVMDRPDSGTAVIRLANGQVSTMTREPGGRIALISDGLQQKVYFRKAE